jgi:hypothetical protein
LVTLPVLFVSRRYRITTRDRLRADPPQFYSNRDRPRPAATAAEHSVSRLGPAPHRPLHCLAARLLAR